MQLGEAVAAASFASIDALEDKVDPGTPIVIVFGPSYSAAAGLKEVQKLTRSRPEVAAIMVVQELSTQMLQQALRAGVRDVVAAPAETGQLIEAIDRAAETISISPVAPAGEPEPLADQGRMICVFSTNSGAAKSVVD